MLTKADAEATPAAELPTPELREAKLRMVELRLLETEISTLHRNIRDRRQRAEERFDTLMEEFNGQMELPFDSP